MKKFKKYLIKNNINSINIKIKLLKNSINKKFLLFIFNFIKFLSNQIPYISIKNNNILILININKNNFLKVINRIFIIILKKLNLKLNKFNINNFINNNIYKFILINSYIKKCNIYIYILFNNNILLLNIITLKMLGFKF